MKPTYRIKDWDKHFENHESRKVKRSYWVPIPNRHDGKSYRRIAAHPDGVSVFAAWILILEAASKMPERGVLADEDGPLDADDLSAMTGFPAGIFEAAFRLLTEIRVGWLEAVEAKPRRRKSPGTSRNLPQSPAVPGTAAVELQGTELQDTEQKGTKDSAKAGASATVSETGNVEFTIWKLCVGKLMSVGMDEPAARSFIGQQCKTYGKDSVSTAITKLLAQEPADPKAYLVKILQNGVSDGTNKPAGYQTATERRDADFRGYASVVSELRSRSSGAVDETVRRKPVSS